MGRILRGYSYLYHLALALFLIGIAIVAFGSGTEQTLRMRMLPWEGASLAHWILWGSVVGILTILLAATGKLPQLFPLYAMVVLVLMARGYLFGSYVFSGRDEFNTVLWMIGGALLAFLASLTLFRGRRPRA